MKGMALLKLWKKTKPAIMSHVILNPKPQNRKGKGSQSAKEKKHAGDATCAKFTCNSRKKAAAEGTEDSDVKDQEIGVCFICDIQTPIKDLWLASTLPLNENLKRCAINLLDEKLLAKLSAGDSVAQEHGYHPSSLTRVYNRERAWMNSKNTGDDYVEQRQEACAHAFAELEMYVWEKQLSTDGCCYFKMVELYDLYTKRLEQFGVEALFVYRTRLKEQILARIPELKPFKKQKRSLAGLYKKSRWSHCYSMYTNLHQTKPDSCSYSWWRPPDHRRVCCAHVWQKQLLQGGKWSQAWPLCKKAESLWQHSTHKGFFKRALQESCIIKPNSHMQSKFAQPTGMGMGTDDNVWLPYWATMAAVAKSCQELWVDAGARRNVRANAHVINLGFHAQLSAAALARMNVRGWKTYDTHPSGKLLTDYTV